MKFPHFSLLVVLVTVIFFNYFLYILCDVATHLQTLNALLCESVMTLYYNGTYCNIGIQMSYLCLFCFDKQVVIAFLLFFCFHLEVG